MRVVVLNTVLSNTGDAAIYEAITNSLVKSGVANDAEIIAFDSAAKYTQRLYPAWRIYQQPTRSTTQVNWLRRVSNVSRTLTVRAASRSSIFRNVIATALPRSDVGAFINLLRRADLVISSGGTYLVDHYNFQHRVDELELAKALKRTVVLWTQSLGPFRTPRSVRSAERLSSVVDFAFLRDERSSSVWDRVAEREARSLVVPDVVFAIDTPQSLPANAPEDSRKLAILSVRSWDRSVNGGPFSFETYRQGMRALATELIRTGWRCVALSTCQGVPGYTIDDAVVAEEIFAGIAVEIDHEFHSPTELQTLLVSADLVIATRMHMAILSLVNQVPVFAIAYETKSLELFQGLGRPDSVVPIEMVSPDWVRSVFATENVSKLPLRLSTDALEAIRAQASRPAEVVLANYFEDSE